MHKLFTNSQAVKQYQSELQELSETLAKARVDGDAFESALKQFDNTYVVCGLIRLTEEMMKLNELLAQVAFSVKD